MTRYEFRELEQMRMLNELSQFAHYQAMAADAHDLPDVFHALASLLPSAALILAQDTEFPFLERARACTAAGYADDASAFKQPFADIMSCLSSSAHDLLIGAIFIRAMVAICRFSLTRSEAAYMASQLSEKITHSLSCICRAEYMRDAMGHLQDAAFGGLNTEEIPKGEELARVRRIENTAAEYLLVTR
jgi:hypothetical protein